MQKWFSERKNDLRKVRFESRKVLIFKKKRTFFHFFEEKSKKYLATSQKKCTFTVRIVATTYVEFDKDTHVLALYRPAFGSRWSKRVFLRLGGAYLCALPGRCVSASVLMAGSDLADHHHAEYDDGADSGNGFHEEHDDA